MSRLLAVMFLCITFLPPPLAGESSHRHPTAKPAVFEWKQLDGNNLSCTIASDGPYADFRKTNWRGLEWPRGTGKYAVYTAGLWIVGYHRPSGLLRTAVMDYNPEYQPGPLLEQFNTSTNDDSAPVGRAQDFRYRLYKVEAENPQGDLNPFGRGKTFRIPGSDLGGTVFPNLGLHHGKDALGILKEHPLFPFEDGNEVLVMFQT